MFRYEGMRDAWESEALGSPGHARGEEPFLAAALGRSPPRTLLVRLPPSVSVSCWP